MNDVLVSVVCFAYNHERYIEDAMEGCLSQRVNFKYEIIVHDDASTDGTADIIRRYEAKYPAIVKGIYETENLYSQNCFIPLLQGIIMAKATGKYIMWCEGDDYWIDPTKMQRQIGYLEQNPDCAMVVHSAAVLDMKNVIVSALPQYWEDKNLSPEEVINHPNGYIESATMAYRREDFELKGFYNEAGVGDYTTQLYCLTKGKIYYMDRIMSVYRFGREGSWQSSQRDDGRMRLKHCVNMIRFLIMYNQYTDSAYFRQIIKEVNRYAGTAADIIAREKISNNLADVQLRTDIDYKEYLDEIFKIYNQIYNLNYCAKKTEEFFQRNKKILIMGAGKYAAVLTEQLISNGMEFEGFVVSPGQNADKEFLGKTVYQLNALPYNKEDVGILVGIHAGVWEEVEAALIENGIAHYYCPYLFTFRGINT